MPQLRGNEPILGLNNLVHKQRDSQRKTRNQKKNNYQTIHSKEKH
jgi:hypothetical protein